MGDFVDGILERPTGQKAAIWIGSVLLVAFLFWQYGYKGLSEEHAELTGVVETLSSDLLNEQRTARELPKMRAAVKELDEKLAVALRELPDKAEIGNLLAQVSALAKDAGLDVTFFSPRGETKKDFYAEVPVSVMVEGTYHQVAVFFDEVGRLPRIVNISEIGMKEPKITPGESKVKLKTSCTATTFRFLDESERVKPDGEQPGRRRRGGPAVPVED